MIFSQGQHLLPRTAAAASSASAAMPAQARTPLSPRTAGAAGSARTAIRAAWRSLAPILPALALAAAVLMGGVPGNSARAQTTLKTAKVTMSEGTVNKGPLGKTASSPLTKGVTMSTGEYARTGAASRAEFEFADRSLFRIGERTIFSFEGGSRALKVDEGEGLLSVPKGQGNTTITTPALSAAVMGTTIYVSVRPGSVTYACLEGRCKVGPHMMMPGQILRLTGTRRDYAAPLRTFNIRDFARTNGLMTRFRSRLPGAKLIEQEAAAQDAASTKKPSPPPKSRAAQGT